jgi:Zn-dependent protease with chaperone function
MNESRATRYQRHKRLERSGRLLAAGGALGLVAATPMATALAGAAWTAARAVPSWTAPVSALLLFAAAVLIIVEVVSLSVRLIVQAGGGAAPGSRDRAPLRAALAAEGQAILVAGPAALVAALAVQTAIWSAGRSWWLAAGLLIATGSWMAMHLAPFVMAAFTGARPIDSPALAARLAQVCRLAAVPVDRVDEIPVQDGDDTSAFVAGLGPRRRVFLASTLIRDFSEDEIAVVVAHELGHHRRGDLARTLALDAAILVLGLGAAAWVLPVEAQSGSLAALPAIGWIAGAVWTAAAPLRHAQSRHHERQADAFALALTGAADAFSTVVRRLGARRLADEEPSTLARWLTYRHPPVEERLAAAKAFAARRG